MYLNNTPKRPATCKLKMYNPILIRSVNCQCSVSTFFSLMKHGKFMSQQSITLNALGKSSKQQNLCHINICNLTPSLKSE